MCGIAGVLSFIQEVDREGLFRMSSCLESRGPDDEGLFSEREIGLVHRRLSILDLSPGAKCPMPNEDGSVQVLLNGEIYNWRELRSVLVDRGHRFKSFGDSEVIAHGYEEWGDRLLERLRGMFALAIWDGRRSRLVLARDRAGEKPLFVMHSPGRTLFASSTNALLAYDGKLPKINSEALVCYLAHGFIPSTHVAFDGVMVLPPANYAIIDKCDCTFHCYWKLPEQRPERESVLAAERRVEATLIDSVRRCMDTDVPVGVLLSGGVDSSLIAAFASRNCKPLKSFSVGFDEPAWSEVKYARKVASHLGLEHYEALMRPEDVLKVLPELVWHYGQPFGDPSAIPTFLLSRLASKHVKVCLSGDGGDELFAGYWRVMACLCAQRYASLVPAWARKGLDLRAADLLGRRFLALNRLSLARGAAARYSNWETWHTNLAEIAGPTLEDGLAHDRVSCRMAETPANYLATPVQQLLYDDFKVQLPDAYLAKIDVASMAASLEVRAPMLDVEVIQSAWSVADNMKVRFGRRKWLLKRIAARLVPRDVIYRPKMGLAMPLSNWFRGPIGDTLERLLEASRAGSAGYINVERASKELEEHRTGAKDNSVRLWLLLWLELWFRIVFCQDMAREKDLSELL